MSILKIARRGHPVLRDIAAAVADPTADAVKRLVADMVETLADIGGPRRAPPQVHLPPPHPPFQVAAPRTPRRARAPRPALPAPGHSVGCPPPRAIGVR